MAVMKAESTAAFTVVRYAVVTGGREPMELRDEDKARQLARRRGGKVYECVGEPATGLWRPAVLICEFDPPTISRPCRYAA